MKKYFKFLAVAAIVATGLVGCSNETPVNPDDGNGKVTIQNQSETYATFSFVSDAPDTRAGLGGDASENTTAVSYRLIIFDGSVAAGSLELDSTITAVSSPMTVKILSGQKQIYVMQSPNSAFASPFNTKLVVGTAVTPAALNTTLRLLSIASAPGTPNVDNISQLYNPTFFLSNRTDSTEYNIASGVTEADSKLSSNSNNIKIMLRRAVAKVYVSQKPASNLFSVPGKTITADSAGVITESGSTPAVAPTYRMLNVLTELYPFQYYNGTVLTTPHMNDVHPAYENYVARGETKTAVPPFFPLNDTIGLGGGAGTYGSDINIVVSATPSPSAGGSYYITENTSSELRVASFAAIKAQFTPTKNHYLTGVAYNNTGAGSFNPTPAIADLAVGTTFYYLKYLPVGGPGGLSVGTIAADKTLAQKITYHLINPGNPEQGSYAAVTDANVATYFSEYTNGICYYRMDLGDYKTGSDGKAIGSAKYGVKRNNFYKMNIDGFLQLGTNRVADLIGKPGEKLKGETYLTVSVEIVPWEEVNGGGWF